MDNNRPNAHSPIVSVILPVYNGEKHLVTAIESVLGQNFTDYELILVNHRSSDNTQHIIDDYQKRYPDLIRTFFVETGTTVSTPRNFALEHARGLYVSFLDHDDAFDPHFLERLLAASDNMTADIVSCESQSVTEQGDILNSVRLKQWDEKTDGNYVYVYGLCTTAIIKRSLIQDNNITFPVNKTAEDTLFCRQTAFMANKIVFIDFFGYLHVNNPSSVTHKGDWVQSIRYDTLPFDEYAIVLPSLFAKTAHKEMLVYDTYLDFFSMIFVIMRLAPTKDIQKATRLFRNLIRDIHPLKCRNHFFRPSYFKGMLPLHSAWGPHVLFILQKLRLMGAAAILSNALFRLLYRFGIHAHN